MKLKAIYDKQEDIPAGFESAYTERNGKWELQVEGMKTQGDVERVQEALDKERDEHKKAKKRLRGMGDDDDADSVQDLKDKVEDLEAKLETAGKDKVSDEEIQKRVDAAVKIEIRPLQRDLKKVTEERDELSGTVSAQSSQINSGLIRGDVARVIGNKDLGINPESLPDIEMFADNVMEVGEDGNRTTREGVTGVTPGLSLEEAIKEFRANGQRNPWFGETRGTGSGGGDGKPHGGKNPFSEKHWNSTEQGKLIEGNPTLAKSLAEQAGGKGLKIYNRMMKAA